MTLLLSLREQGNTAGYFSLASDLRGDELPGCDMFWGMPHPLFPKNGCSRSW
jgi:hypothetical protein